MPGRNFCDGEKQKVVGSFLIANESWVLYYQPKNNRCKRLMATFLLTKIPKKFVTKASEGKVMLRLL
jgi:hypothetical protein